MRELRIYLKNIVILDSKSVILYIKFYMNYLEISLVINLRSIPSQGFNNYILNLLYQQKCI
jgi:hypothetical protein